MDDEGCSFSTDARTCRLASADGAATDGCSLAAHGAPFGTDGGMLFQKLGVKSLLWGPGSIQNAHQPDEWIELRDLAQMECDLPRLLGRLVV